MKLSVAKQLFIACISFKTDTRQPGTKDSLSNITEEIPKLQKVTGEHQQFTISVGETQIINTYQGGRKTKPFSPGTDFRGLVFTGELSGVDSAGEAGCLDEDVFKMSWSRQICLPYSYVFGRFLDQYQYNRHGRTSSRRLQDVSPSRLQNFLITSLRHLPKTSSKHLQEVFKASSRHVKDVMQKRPQDIFKTSSWRAQDIFKTSCKDVFKNFSIRMMELNFSL